MDKRVLVIGGSGLVGSALMNVLWNKLGSNVVGTFYSNPLDDLISLEMQHPQSIREVINQIKPNDIYISAYIGNVNRCEQDGIARHINVDGVKTVVEEAKKINSRVVFFSSSYVFDGTKEDLYTVWDIPHPLQQYGIQKLIGEEAVLSSDPRNVVVRVSGIFGNEDKRKNFAYQVIDALRQNKQIMASTRYKLNPIHSELLASSVVQMVNDGYAGVLHVGGSECVTKYEWAYDIAKRFELNDELVVPVDSFFSEAPRPVNGCLKNNISFETDYNADLDRFYKDN